MAAVDYFLKLAGIEGESTDSKHKGEIDVLSWSMGVTNSGQHGGGGGGGAGKASHQDIHFTAKMSKASPKLWLACSEGTHIASATLVCRKAGGTQQEYLTIKMHEVHVASYQTGGSASGDVVPTDQFSINFAKKEIDYKEQKADGSLGGSVKTGYDLKLNKKV